MSIRNEYDVIVIGGGPGGMMAAGRAAERGLRVLLIEKNEVLGKKLSITGGGRCNITNAEFDTRTLLKHYGEAEHFLYSPFSQFGVQETFDFFSAQKLPLIIEERKRAFPKTEKATDVTRVMMQYLEKAGVTVLLKTAVQGFKTDNDEITGVITDQGIFTAHSYVIASGGKSHSDTGSTGEGISWLKLLGHTTHEPNPNLVPLVVNESWVKKLSGTTLEKVRITFAQGKDTLVRQGNVLITHFGFSGPTILNAAHDVKQMLTKGTVHAHIDLFPNVDVGELRTRLHTLFESHPNRSLENSLKEWFPKGVVALILKSIPEETYSVKVNSVVREVRHALVDRMKNVSCIITGTMGYDWAIVSDGGVDLKEIDTRTMQSTLHPNLYFVGDILHVNRPSGGYSLQLCWTTGFVAGSHVCENNPKAK
ncbi:MAG: NAD(P)/FAD-dependent oxidoreductase [Minisyncoccia bacterium]